MFGCLYIFQFNSRCIWHFRGPRLGVTAYSTIDMYGVFKFLIVKTYPCAHLIKDRAGCVFVPQCPASLPTYSRGLPRFQHCLIWRQSIHS